eukprot:3290087-Prymnesium_polylepis.2
MLSEMSASSPSRRASELAAMLPSRFDRMRRTASLSSSPSRRMPPGIDHSWVSGRFQASNWRRADAGASRLLG